MARSEAFERWHDDFDTKNELAFHPLYREQRPDFPVAAFTLEGRAIAHALKASLPADGAVVYENVDAWLRPKGLPLQARQLILAPEPPPEPA